ncbi:unnamed protein product [Prorocentrum cordatum]|uniref:SAM domain-containing protein n=1 Tax=Prorocentrum cordatum TaxID=2364126 RepID=A0ABN9Y2T0_9DINO|nr:unnamed protein product [Polarella glacialis]
MPAAMPGLVAALSGQEWLRGHVPTFAEQGVDDLETLFPLREQGLTDAGVNIGHKTKLRNATSKRTSGGAKSVPAVALQAREQTLAKVRNSRNLPCPIHAPRKSFALAPA